MSPAYTLALQFSHGMLYIVYRRASSASTAGTARLLGAGRAPQGLCVKSQKYKTDLRKSTTQDPGARLKGEG